MTQNRFPASMETDRGVARANGIEITYQEFGSRQRETVLLIPGVGGEMATGPDRLTRELVSRGFHVVEYDSRDSGQSTHFTSAGAPDWQRIQAALLSGEAPPVAYTVDDLAADAVDLLTFLNIENAHIVGGSLGGMVAQTIAAKYPGRVRSLTSISSTTGNPALPTGSAAAGLAAAPQSEHDAAAAARQGAAAAVAGDRRAQLRTIRAPTAVIHGDADSMFPVEHGRDTAATIPGATLHIIAGMGHALPDTLAPAIADIIADQSLRARAPAKASAESR